MTAPTPAIIAVIGPKGGVGKSTISANLAICLARTGARVIAVDLDLGSANLNVLFGLRNVPCTLDDFLMGKIPELDQAVLPTGIEGLSLISGGNVPGIASLPYQRKIKLMRHLRKLPCDYLLLDLAAGVTNNVVDFALMAGKSLLVTTPDVPSLMSLYSFLKTMVFRRMALYLKQAGATEILALLEMAKDAESHPELKTFEALLERARAVDPQNVEKMRRVNARFAPVTLVNRASGEAGIKAGATINKLMEKFLSITVHDIMTVREDPAVTRAAMKLRPVLIEEPGCPFGKDLQRAAAFIVNKGL
ncbi:magnetosome protein Mad29 [Fundidesulfovibrio magnetotacticus]|uniref:Magnetosome protein Mad29 n=1 Tax=Fundidesulfovibrio magnetotacticus TaxID=2730080 RepID=A0A6V8LRU2_9BACT|nr:P-loop NTPase [Fundidesulfovibrio magnetotacticus]GFK92317.1 magnetosome protein Mad29 [Fundidesulfovibrio magnetotacticus]